MARAAVRMGEPMRIDVLTLFPDMFAPVLNQSILGRALRDNDQRPAPLRSHVFDIRDYTTDKHGKVDQPPYGGGPGMVMQCQPVWDAVCAAEAQDPTPAHRILMTPQGRRLDQVMVERLAQMPRLLIIAGHYEGLDERVVQKLAPIQEISIGDYVLTGGELPAMVLIDAAARLVPGVLGHQDSAVEDSFNDGLLDCPHYTRPEEIDGRQVPEVLLSGNHGAIRRWRLKQSLGRTWQRRPDLLDGGTLDKEQRELLEEYLEEHALTAR